MSFVYSHPFTGISSGLQTINGGGGQIVTDDFDSETGWTKTGSVVFFSSGKLRFDDSDQDIGDRIYKQFTDLTLSDTLWTMHVNDSIWTQVSGTPAPSFIGASDTDNNMADANTLDFLGVNFAGRGSTNKGENIAHKDGASGVSYGTAWVGNGSGTDNWLTFKRTSATGCSLDVYPTSARSSSDFSDTDTIASTTNGLNARLFSCQSAGVGGRDSDVSVEQIIWYDSDNV